MCSNAYWTCGVCRALIAFLLSAVTAKYYSEWDENKTGTFLRAEWIEVGSLQQRFCIFAFLHSCNSTLATRTHVICAHLATAYQSYGLSEAYSCACVHTGVDEVPSILLRCSS